VVSARQLGEAHLARIGRWPVNDGDLRSPERQLIELRIEHADLDSLIDRVAQEGSDDHLALRRLKKRRLLLRDRIIQLERQLQPPEPA
jgi:hypothetical protein